MNNLKPLLKPPFAYYGGKQKMMKHILPYIPEHNNYVEVFGGSGALLFAKPQVKNETYNDYDDRLYNFFTILKDPNKYQELIHMLELTPYCEKMFHEAKEHYYDEDKTDVEKAYYYFIMNVFSMSSIGREFTYNIIKNIKLNSYLNKIEYLPLLHDRIRHTQILSRSFEKVLTAFNNDYTFLYLDPPYNKASREKNSLDRYKYEFTDKQHQTLVDMLIDHKGMIILSGYQNDIYKPLSDKWHVINIPVKVSASNTIRSIRNEVLWINPYCWERIENNIFQAGAINE